MLRTITLPSDNEYDTLSEHQPLEFFQNAYSESKEAYLLFGYFTSSSFRLLTFGLAKFIANGGVLNIIANDIVSQEDYRLFNDTEELIINSEFFNKVMNVEALKDELDKHFLSCIAFLIKNERFNIKFIKPSGGKGIAHSKKGVFSDGRDSIRFSGSSNHTFAALNDNIEAIDIQPSWHNPMYEEKCRKTRQQVLDFLGESINEVTYVPATNLQFSLPVDCPSLDELLVKEQKIVAEYAPVEEQKLKTILDEYDDVLQAVLSTPIFPYFKGPREYQKEAYAAWVKNNHSGIFQMATGTGKTLTALNCVLENAKKENGGYHVIVLVPSDSLVRQWVDNIKKFNFQNVIPMASAFPKAKSQVQRVITESRFIPTDFFIVCTYDSLTSDRTFGNLLSLSAGATLICDEVHRAATKNIANRLLRCQFAKKLGLSATVNRQFDDFGNDFLRNYFNDAPPFTYSFSMKRAIDEDYLCQYYYYPKIVYLTPDEQTEFDAFSARIAHLYDKRDDPETSERLEILLQNRAKILYKASGKKDALRNLIADWPHPNLKYTLLYVPEGFIDNDEGISHKEEKRLIEEYSQIVLDTYPDGYLTLSHFTSMTANREQILKNFSSGVIDVLASMKCLDEGIDVARSQNAIFCSSTSNPKQFVQRRGRVLRKHEKKEFAHIYDFVVLPNPDSYNSNSSKSILKKEMTRIVDFASCAKNKLSIREQFTKIAQAQGLSYASLELDANDKTDENTTP